MKTEQEIEKLLQTIERNKDFHLIVLQDCTVSEITTAKQVLKWVLEIGT